MAGSELSSAAPPGVSELSITDENEDEENTFHNDRPSLPKEVNNYSGKYTRDEMLALHRLDYPIPQQFALEEDITSKTALEPVAFTKYTRKPQDGLRESHFFGLGKSTKGPSRGRGRRHPDEHGLNYSTTSLDPRSVKSESHLDPRSDPHSLETANPTRSPSSIQSSQNLTSSGNPQSVHSGVTSTSHHYNPVYNPNSFGEDLIFDDEKWYYKDPENQEQGPFRSMQMDRWVKYNFFQVDLMVRRENTEYGYLGDIFFSEGRNPFTGEPLDRWFKGPSSEFKISLMLLIQNYHLNRMKQDQPQLMEYQFNLNTNPGELNTSYPNDPYQSFHISQPLLKSSSAVTTVEPKPNPETITLNAPEKQEEAWYLTSSDINTTHSKYNQPFNQSQQQKDWTTLQQEQTIAIQKIVAQMNKPKKAKKRKGKKVNTTNNQPPAKPSQNVPSVTPKKSEDVKPNPTNYSEPKSNSHAQSSQNTQKKNANQPDKNKPQSPPQPTHPRQSINKKPKPQYKVKEPTEFDPEQNPEPKSEDVAQPSNQTQLSKRQNVRQPKVWKRKDEGVNDEHN